MQNAQTRSPKSNYRKPRQYIFLKRITSKIKAYLNHLYQPSHKKSGSKQRAKIYRRTSPYIQIQEQKRSNKIAVTAMWVNAILMLITAAVFGLSWIALRYTRDDVKDASKQFEISNRPFIAIGDMIVDSIGEGQKPTIRFNFYNSGKFPAKIICFSYVKGGGPGSSTDEVVKALLSSVTPTQGKFTNIILSSYPIRLPTWITDFYPISKLESDSLKNGTKIFFLSIEVKYRNFLTDTPYLKKETYKIAAGPTFSISLIDATEGTF